jgi:hypothetical protein
MVLGAIAALMIDRRFEWAAGYSFFGAVLAAGYLALALLDGAAE